jgi:hypothetical protein
MMTRKRLATLASGLFALVLGPAVAGAQSTKAYGGDRYGGAKVEEQNPSSQAPAAPTAQPNEVQRTSGTDDQSTQATPEAKPSDQSNQSQTTTTPSTTNSQNVTVQPAPSQSPPPAAPAAPQVVTPPAPSPEVNVYMPERRIEEHHVAPYGMAISVGGGVNQFAGREMRDITDVGGQWEARLTLGTRSLIGMEAAYVGTAAGIKTLGLDDRAVLLSNGVEGLARLNIGTFRFQPFLVGGVSWIRYNIENASFNTSDLNNQDDVVAIPFGGGVSTYLGGKDTHFMVDARFIYRAAFDDNLARPGTADAGGTGLSNWSATLRLGYEF